ncbi:MAG: cyclic nucleotide-binding domain-containing protein [Candidatus Dormibacteraeota bacterium]|nr:cyclic nucleotide-binding domain-containing protein [Candidatus Dormibacteraeota bacterium]
MDAPLVVLIDGEPTDSALVRNAREYADAKGCSVTLLGVFPEANRAYRTDTGVEILPWQIMQMMEADGKSELEKLRMRFLRGRSLPNTMLVRFGNVIEQVASVADTEHAQAVLARSRKETSLLWLKRDRRLQRRLAVPLLLLDAADKLIGNPAPERMARPLSFADKMRAIRQVPVFAGLPRKKLESIARHLDEFQVEEGTTLIHEGRSNQTFWIVVDGELVRTLRGKLLDRITPPSLVGLPSMLDGQSATATVTAVTPVRALIASTEQFRVLSADDRIALRLWEQAGARLRRNSLHSLGMAG